MNANIDLAYAETCNESTNSCYLVHVLKDNTTNNHYLQVSTLTFSTSNYRITVTKPEQKEFASGYGIDDKTQYCLLRGTGTSFTADPHLFFSIGKKFISIAGVMIKFISIKTSEQEKMPPQATSYPCTPTETPLKWDLHSATDIFIFAI